MNKWRVEYQNEEYGHYGEGLRRWWEVSDGETTYSADSEEAAERLAHILNAVGA